MSATAEHTRIFPKVSPQPLVSEIENDLTRREFLFGAGLLVFAAGCGSGEEPGDEEGSGDKRTIDHKFGTTEVSGRPKRVVTVGLTEQDYVPALGVAPVGVREWFGEYPGALWPWAREKLGDRPMPEVLPVEELVAPVEARFERTRANHPEFEGSTGLLAAIVNDGSFYVYAEGPAPRFLTTLGLEMPRTTAELFSGDDRAPVQVSRERLEVLEADVLALGLYGADEASLADDRVYGALDVAREGRDIPMPEFSRLNGALSFGSVLSLPITLEEMVPRISAAIGGDAATETTG